MARQPTPMVPVRYDTVLPASRDQMSRDVNAANMLSQLNDPEAFLGFGGPRTSVLPSIARIAETPSEEAERRAQAGDFAKGIGLGLTTDIAGLAGDLPALLLSDAPKFAAALAMGKSFDEMPSTVLDEGLNAIRDAVGSDALAGYLGNIFGFEADPETLAKPGVTTGRLLSSIVDPVVIGGAIKGLINLRKSRATTPETQEGIATLAPQVPEAPEEGIGSLSANQRREAALEIMANAGTQMGRLELENFIARADDARTEPDNTLLADFFGEEAGTRMNELLSAPGAQMDIGADFDVVGERAEELLQARLTNPTELEDIVAGNQFGFQGAEQLARQRARFGAMSDQELIEEYQTITGAGVDITELDPQQATRLSEVINEMAGRRGNELTRLTEEERLVNEQTAMEAYGPGLTGTAPSQKLTTAMPAEGIDSLPLSLSQGLDDLVPLSGDDFETSLAGIGSLGEVNPVYAENALVIGGEADQFGGRVKHYTPAMQDFVRFTESDTFKTQASASGEITGEQIMSALTKNKESRDEIVGSEFEKIMNAEPNKKYNKNEVIRLLTSVVPQTRTKTVLNSNLEAPFERGIPFATEQFTNLEKSIFEDTGVTVFSSTSPTIDIPGFGRLKPKGIRGHDYYNAYPGYFAHGRFGIATDVENNRWMIVPEGQGNQIGAVSSGNKVGYGRDRIYTKDLKDRLDAYMDDNHGTDRLGRRRGGDEVKIPYTDEVHKYMLRIDSLKPKVMTEMSDLKRQVAEYEDAAAEIQSSVHSYMNPERITDAVSVTYNYNSPVQKALLEDDNFRAQIFTRIDSGADGNNADMNAVEALITDKMDSMGIDLSPNEISSIDRDVRAIKRALDKNLAKAQEGEAPNSIPHYNLASYYTRKAAAEDPRTVNFKSMSAEDYLNLSPSEQLRITVLENTIGNLKNHLNNFRQTEVMNDDKFISFVNDLDTTDLDLNDGDVKKKLVEDAFDALSEGTKQRINEVVKARQAEMNNRVGLGVEVETQLFDPDQSLDDKIKTAIYSLMGDSNIKNIKDKVTLRKLEAQKQEALDRQAVIQNDYNQATTDFSDAIENDADAAILKDLLYVAKDSIDSNGVNGFMAVPPYSRDKDFYEFFARSMIKEAEDLGLDGVIFPDSHYILQRPGRDAGPVQLKNYGEHIDTGLKQFTEAEGMIVDPVNAGLPEAQRQPFRPTPEVELKNHRNDPTPILFRQRDSNGVPTGEVAKDFTVKGIDVRNPDIMDQLQPVLDDAESAKNVRREADKDLKRLNKELEREQRKQDPDIDRVQELEESIEDAITVAGEAAADEAQAMRDVTAKKSELAEEYSSPLRVVRFSNRDNQITAQRPIRRAAGGMVRSGIGSMAREVM